MNEERTAVWLVTGAGGFVGSRIVSWGENLEKVRVIGFTRRELDFTDEKQVERVLEQYKPQALFHTGAVSDTGACQKNPEWSYEINVKGTEYLARACKDFKTRMIFFSSDQVYAGTVGNLPHKEEERLSPSNVYGRQKLEGEELVERFCPDSVSLRLAWMYDLPHEGRKVKPNFVTRILEGIQEELPLCFSDRDYRGITDVGEVISRLSDCIRIPAGVYNWGSGNDISAYETAREAVRFLDPGKLFLVQRQERGFERNLLMDQGKVLHWGIHFPDTLTGIERCLRKK